MAKVWDFDDYDDWLPRYDEYMRSSHRLHYEETLRRLPDLAGVHAGDLVLDIGTGTGNSAVPFLERGCRVVGVDPSAKMLELARAKSAQWPGQLTLEHVDDPFLGLPVEDHAFNAVVTAYAMHHLDDGAKRVAIGEMNRALRPGGRIVVADTMFRDLAHKAYALEHDQSLEDEYQPLLDTFPGMFEDEGLTVEMTRIGELVWVLTARAGRAR